MANPNITKNAGKTLSGNYTITGDLQVLGRINNNNQQNATNQSAAAGLSTRLTDSFGQPGTIWNSVTSPLVFPFGVDFGNGLFMAADSSGNLSVSSTNGLTWGAATTPAGATRINFVKFGPVNGGTWIIGTNTNKIYYSTNNGTSWTLSLTGASLFYCAAYGNGLFMAAGGGRVYTSPDGVNWTNAAAIPTTTSWNCLAFNGTTWVLVGTPTGGIPVFYSKDNGVTWTGASFVGPTQNAVISLGKIFVCGASGSTVITTSPDGITWTVHSTSLTGSYINGLGSGGSIFIATDNLQQMATSYDGGINWTVIGSYSNAYPGTTCFAWGNNTFVAAFSAASAGGMWYSTWLSYGKSYLYVPSFQGFGTPTAINFFWQRKPGSNTISVWGKLTAGTTTAVEARIGIPVGLLSDAALIPSIMMAPGMWDSASVTYTGSVPIVLIESGVSYVTFGFIGGAAGLSKLNATTIIATGNIMSIWFELPVSGWN